MAHFIFAVEVPPVPDNSHGISVSPEFASFSKEADTKTKQVSSVKKLQSNVWLFPAENNLSVLSGLVASANNYSLPYSSLLIEGFTELSPKKSGGMQKVAMGGI